MPNNTSKYELLNEIGRGSYGVVSKAIDKTTNKEVAYKIIDKKKLNRTKYENEIDIMKKIKSKYCVKIIDQMELNDSYVIIMELCDGNLDSLLKIKRKLSVEEIRKMFIQLNETFSEMHKKKIVHRDLKLQNIFYIYTNESKTEFDVKLGDFGFGKVVENDITKTVLGTPQTMAPEIYEGKGYSNKSELWSIGIILYKLYFNDYPYRVKKRVKPSQIKPINLQLSENPLLNDLILRLLIIDPKDRITWEEYFNHDFFKESVTKNENMINKKINIQSRDHSEYELLKESIYGQEIIKKEDNDVFEDKKANDKTNHFRKKYFTKNIIDFGFKSSDHKIYYSINSCDNKSYFIKEYSNNIFSNYNNQFVKALQLSRNLSSNTYTLQFKDHFQTEKYIYVIYEYIENMVPLSIYAKENSLTEEQIKTATNELLVNLFINAEQNNFIFDIITEYSFMFIPNKNRLILCDFGFLKYTLEKSESSSYFTSHEINHINNKTNVFNFGISIYNTFFKTKLNAQTINNAIQIPNGIKYSKVFKHFLSKMLNKNPNTRANWKSLCQHSFICGKQSISNRVLFTKDIILRMFEILSKKYNPFISALLNILAININKIVKKEFIMFLQITNLEMILLKTIITKLMNYSPKTVFNKDEEICFFKLKTGLQYPSNFHAININLEQISCIKSNLILKENITNEVTKLLTTMEQSQKKLENFIKNWNKHINYYPPYNSKQFTEDVVNVFRSQELPDIVNTLCKFGNEDISRSNDYYLIAKTIDEFIIVIRNLALNKVEQVTDGETITKFFTQENHNQIEVNISQSINKQQEQYFAVSFLSSMFKIYFKEKGTFNHSEEDEINELKKNNNFCCTQSFVQTCSSNMNDVIENYLTLLNCINESL